MKRSLRYGVPLFYAAYFAALGVWAPFWPLWLESRGLSASAVGVLLAIGFWTQVAVEPLIGRASDRWGRASRLISVLLFAAIVGYSLFVVTDGFWIYAALAAWVGATFPVVLPLIESLSVRYARRSGRSYGRLRLWGSLAFVAVSLGAGRLVEVTDSSTVVFALIVLLGVAALASHLLPAVPTSSRAKRTRSIRALGGRFALFVFTACLVQASHATYYGFSSIHWSDLGYGETWIGGFWALAVVAEVALFFANPSFIRRFDPTVLVALGAAGGCVRWTALTWADGTVVILLIQTMHAVSFGVTHLAVMRFMAERVPEYLSSSAMAIYTASLAGLGMGALLPVAGVVYESFGNLAFLLSSALSVVAIALALFITLRERATTSAVPTNPARRFGTA